MDIKCLNWFRCTDFRSNSQSNGPPGSGNSEGSESSNFGSSRVKSRSVDRIPRLPDHHGGKSSTATTQGRQRATWRVPNTGRRASDYPSRLYNRGGNKDDNKSPRTKSDGEVDVSPTLRLYIDVLRLDG